MPKPNAVEYNGKWVPVVSYPDWDMPMMTRRLDTKESAIHQAELIIKRYKLGG